MVAMPVIASVACTALSVAFLMGGAAGQSEAVDELMIEKYMGRWTQVDSIIALVWSLLSRADTERQQASTCTDRYRIALMMPAPSSFNFCSSSERGRGLKP